MKILIVGLVGHPQVKRLQEEAKKRGHVVEGCYTSELTMIAGNEKFEVSLRGKEIGYDLIYLWAVGRRRWEWYTACEYLNKVDGVFIVNRKVFEKDYNYFLTPVSDYLKQYDAKLPYPKSAIVFSGKSIDSVFEEFNFPIIVKSSVSHQGRGIYLVNSMDGLKNKINEILKKAPCAIIREYIPNDGDIRIFTVGYKAIGAMKRTPAREGEFRSNISQGGKGEKFDLESYPQIKSIAEKLSVLTRTEIAGVDIMVNIDTGKPYILEINPGPQFTGFEKYTGVNAALEIIKYFESLYEKRT